MSREKTVSVEISEPIAPDGGYGWLVVCAAFLAHVITHGILYSFGVLFITIQEKYGGSKVEVSWILSIATGMLYLIGPVAGYLSERYGIKVVTMVGTFLGSLGYFTSMFVSNLQTLYVTIGLITGCGFGMVFLGAIVIVTMYFERRRSLASGIALSGAGSGAFLFSPLIKMLTSTYSLQGTLLILSGVILNCLVCAVMFKQITSYKVKRQSPSNLHSALSAKDTLRLEGDYISIQKEIDAETPYDTVDNSRLEEVTKLTSVNSQMAATILTDSEELTELDRMAPETRNEFYVKNQCGNYVGINNQDSNPCLHNEYTSIHSKKESMVLSGQLLRHYESIEQTEQFILDEAQIKTLSDNEDRLCKCNIFASCLSQFDIFRSKVFVIFVISQFLFFLGFYQPFFFIPDSAKQKGIPQELSVWVVSSIGMSSIMGRIILGYIADKPSVNRMYMFQAALFVAGISTSLVPLIENVWSLFVYAALYGVSTGIVLSLTAVLLSDLLGIGRLSNAFGVNNFFCGTASLIGPPLAGFLYDISGNYTLSFVMTGVFITTSGLLICLVNCVKSENIPIIDK